MDRLAALKPKHVLVEEAGEVPEPLLVATLGPWVTRLTLVGDHQQLPPSVENHKLAQDYQFNTSLMERLVSLGYDNTVTLTDAIAMIVLYAVYLAVAGFAPGVREWYRVSLCGMPPRLVKQTGQARH